jgi:hypothetical protein
MTVDHIPTPPIRPIRPTAIARLSSRFSVPRGLRALNAINVRLFGADLLVVHVQLQGPAPDRTRPGRVSRTRQIIAKTRVINEPEKV